MVVKHCVYKGCESDSRYWEREYMRGVCFIRFPNPLTNKERCLKWIKACERTDLTIEKIMSVQTYICSKHFDGGDGPTKTNADPLPSHLFETNLRNKTTETSNPTNTSNSSKTSNENSFCNLNDRKRFNSNNKLNSNYTQNLRLKEMEFFESNNSCHQNESVSNEHNLINSSLSAINQLKQEPTQEPTLQSDHSLKDNFEYINKPMTDSPFVHSIASNSMINNSSQILLNELSNNDNYNGSEIANNSLPFIIIPSINHTMISTTFSAPVIPIDENKQWFNEYINNEFGLKLSKLKLSVGLIGERLIFSSITGCVVDKQLIIDISGNFDVKVYGISLYAKNNFYKCVPIVITNKLEFDSVINIFSQWKVCVANEVTDSVFEDKIIAIRAKICNISNTIRSKSCGLLIPENGSIRCKSCKILSNRIRRFKCSHIKDIKANN